MEKKIKEFKKTVLDYYKEEGRSHLPWRTNPDAYRVLVSEFMLQQTQVERVVPYFNLWMKNFPSIENLKGVSQEKILSLWSGLGYNRRALFLHRSIQTILEEYKGNIPKEKDLLLKLPGIGDYTAGAIRNFAFNEWTPFIDTNIRRVFIHHFFSKEQNICDKEILSLMDEISYGESPRLWGYALMDYGSYLKNSTKENPNRKSKHYVKQSPFLYSRRWWRSKILKRILAKKHMGEEKLFRDIQDKNVQLSEKEFKKILSNLSEEGFIEKNNDTISLKK